MAHLGKVASTDREVIPYEGYHTTYRTLKGAGVDATVAVFSNDAQRYMLSGITVSDPRWRLATIRVGQPAKRTLTAPGRRPVPSEGRWEIESENESLAVEIRADTIRAFTFTCYTG